MRQVTLFLPSISNGLMPSIRTPIQVDKSNGISSWGKAREFEPSDSCLYAKEPTPKTSDESQPTRRKHKNTKEGANVDFFNHIREDDPSRETLATRRDEVLEFGDVESDDNDVLEVELCKGLICTLD